MQQNGNKIAAICYLVSSVGFYISAAINFFSEQSGMGVTQLCLGSSFLCLAAVYIRNSKNDKENENENDKEHEDHKGDSSAEA